MCAQSDSDTAVCVCDSDTAVCVCDSDTAVCVHRVTVTLLCVCAQSDSDTAVCVHRVTVTVWWHREPRAPLPLQGAELPVT